MDSSRWLTERIEIAKHSLMINFYSEDIVDITYCNNIINVPTRASLAVETKGVLFLWLAYMYLNNKSSACKQISSLFLKSIQMCNDNLTKGRQWVLWALKYSTVQN